MIHIGHLAFMITYDIQYEKGGTDSYPHPGAFPGRGKDIRPCEDHIPVQ
jgi:hypothetical protein